MTRLVNGRPYTPNPRRIAAIYDSLSSNPNVPATLTNAELMDSGEDCADQQADQLLADLEYLEGIAQSLRWEL